MSDFDSSKPPNDTDESAPRDELPAALPAPAANPLAASRVVAGPALDDDSWTPTRIAFGVGWFVVAPLIIAQSRVLVLEALPPSPFVETLRGQPIPFAIVLFTVAEMVLWSVRWSLPGASKAGIGGRPGLPADIRRRIDQARALRDEARVIRSAHAKEIDRNLRKEHRDEIERALVELDASIVAPTFDEARFDAALENAGRIVDERLGSWRKSELREYVESIVIAVIVALGIRLFVFEAFKIPSGSMIPTLLVGDHIFVNKLVYGPQLPLTQKRVWNSLPPARGEVIVFQFPEKPEEDFIKRVIALPGDKLEIKNARVFLNDKVVDRCFVGRTSYVDVPEFPLSADAPLGSQEGDLYLEFLDGKSFLTFYSYSSSSRSNAGPWRPQPGEVYVMGDNRNNSRDSREWWNQKGGGVPFGFIKGRAWGIWLSTSIDKGMKFDRLGLGVMGQPHLPESMHTLQPMLDRCLAPNPPLDRTGLVPNGM